MAGASSTIRDRYIVEIHICAITRDIDQAAIISLAIQSTTFNGATCLGGHNINVSTVVDSEQLTGIVSGALRAIDGVAAQVKAAIHTDRCTIVHLKIVSQIVVTACC